jgi:WD40 repeat protein
LLEDDPTVVITYGHWDSSIKVAKFDEFEGTSKTLRILQTVRCHQQPITSCHTSGSYLVTGSQDTTMRVFRTDYRKKYTSSVVFKSMNQKINWK